MKTVHRFVELVLTSYSTTTAAVSGDGKAWALTWQEDPKGLRPGEEAGPGEGMSGATVRYVLLPRLFGGR